MNPAKYEIKLLIFFCSRQVHLCFPSPSLSPCPLPSSSVSSLSSPALLCPLPTSQHTAPGFSPCVKKQCFHSCFSKFHSFSLCCNTAADSKNPQNLSKKQLCPSKVLAAITYLFNVSSFFQSMPCLLTMESL